MQLHSCLQASVAGEVPLMLSDKLSTNKAIAELESLEGGHTDLTGDSGLHYLF